MKSSLGKIAYVHEEDDDHNRATRRSQEIPQDSAALSPHRPQTQRVQHEHQSRARSRTAASCPATFRLSFQKATTPDFMNYIESLRSIREKLVNIVIPKGDSQPAACRRENRELNISTQYTHSAKSCALFEDEELRTFSSQRAFEVRAKNPRGVPFARLRSQLLSCLTICFRKYLVLERCNF